MTRETNALNMALILSPSRVRRKQTLLRIKFNCAGMFVFFFSVLLILNARSDVMELFFTVMKPNYTFIAHLYLKANRDAA